MKKTSMRSGLTGALCFGLLILTAGISSAATSSNAITGGDPGEGGDFEGNFAYAIDFGESGDPVSSGGQVIGDANFTGWLDTPGAVNIGQNADSAEPSFGDTPNDDALEDLLSDGRWADADPADLTSDLSVTPGQAYQLQLLFVEGWNATAPGIRQFNVYVEDALIAADFDITAVAGVQEVEGGEGINTAGAVLTHSFTAGDDTLNIRLEHGSIDNPRMSGITLEIIPEPASIALVATGTLILVGYGVRRRRAK